MFMVYWSVINFEGDKIPQSAEYDTTEMLTAMKDMEALRTTQREDGSVCHITMSSENPNSVGHPGVAETGPDYNWMKRRTQ